MATKKQRRRRDKDRRHDWEYVYVDDTGREVEVEDSGEGDARTQEKRPDRRPVQARGGRRVEPPSWRRVLKRAAIFAPLMLVVVYVLKPKGASVGTVITQTAFLMAFFIPFSYVMDMLLYRMHRKRTGAAGGTQDRRR